MNTLSSAEIEKIRARFKKLLAHESENDEIKHAAQMLMHRFLSETQKFQDLQGISRKSLAEKIKTSPSYLTQVFRGDKPLNFVTLVRFQKALKIQYRIEAIANSCDLDIEDENLWLHEIKKYRVQQHGYWMFRNSKSASDVHPELLDADLLTDNERNYDYQTIPA